MTDSSWAYGWSLVTLVPTPGGSWGAGKKRVIRGKQA